jgi:hypothetical protein
MRIFTCASCSNTVFFENVRCTHCGHTLAYFPEHGVISAIEPVSLPAEQQTPPDAPQLYTALAKQIEGQYRLCANSSAYGVCNSAVAADDPEPLCQACRLNDIIPDLSNPQALEAWQSLERWKRRLLFSLRELGLPIESRAERPHGLMFSFMSDSPDGRNKVFTGHSDGLITINIAEADDPFREKLRKRLGEGYRTVLGHFRHEIGHYFWDRLIRDSPWLPAYRGIFGDESVDYAESVKRHYSQGAPADWPQHYVSSYATMHPWEDWAETWAHYLHIIDTLGTARAYGLVLRPKSDGRSNEELSVSARSLDLEDFEDLLAGWVPVTVALNSLNRSMGLIDPYPFVLCAEVIKKLHFVHDVVSHWDDDEKMQAKIIAAWLKDNPAPPAVIQAPPADAAPAPDASMAPAPAAPATAAPPANPPGPTDPAAPVATRQPGAAPPSQG